MYYKPKNKLPDLVLEDKIISIFNDSRHNYGTRKIKVKLARQGLIVSRRKIGELMRKHHLVSNYVKHKPKHERQKCNEDDTVNILNREFTREQTMDVVVSDLTYVSVDGIWHYICLLVDLWNREIIGWSVGRHKDAKLVKMAFSRLTYPLSMINIFHTDRGSEFKNKLIEDIIKTFGITRSLSRKGTPLDNAVIESTNHILKTEFIYPNKFSSLRELEVKLFDYIHWYNTERIHGSIGYIPPVVYRQTNSLSS